MSVTKDEVSDLIKANNDQLMASFKELLKDTAGQIKRANETLTEQQMREIKKLNFKNRTSLKEKPTKTSISLILNLRRPSTAPSPLPRSPTLRKWSLTSKKVRNCSWNGKNIFCLMTSLNLAGVRRRIQTTRFSRWFGGRETYLQCRETCSCCYVISKEEEVFCNGCDQKIFTAPRVGFGFNFPIPNSGLPASLWQFWVLAASS